MAKARGGWSAEQGEPAYNRFQPGPQPPVQGMHASGRRTISGEARNIERTSEQGGINYQRTFQVLTFRIERRGNDGDLRESVTVRLRGQRIVGNVREGELVEVRRRQGKRGVIHVRSFRNLATGSVVTATGLFLGWRGALAVVVGLLVLGAGWFAWTQGLDKTQPGPHPTQQASASTRPTQPASVTSPIVVAPPPTAVTSPSASGSATDSGSGKTFPLPNVVGDQLSDAEQILMAQGLVTQVVTTRGPTPGLVVKEIGYHGQSQEIPGPDSQVSVGDTVIIEIEGQSTSPPATSTAGGSPTAPPATGSSSPPVSTAPVSAVIAPPATAAAPDQ